MKKFYFLLMLLPLSTLLMAQVGPSFWQFLADDFEDNPFPRQELLIQQSTDAAVTEANSLEGLWEDITPNFIFPIDHWITTSVDDFTSGELVTVDLTAQSADDYAGSFTMVSGDDALYVLYKVTDDEVVVDKDFVEMHFAPYAEKFDPGREIFPEVARVGAAYQWIGHWWEDEASYSWGWDLDADTPLSWSPIRTGEAYVEMAKYGSWSEVGAYKIDIALESNAEAVPDALLYSLNGPMADTLGDVVNGSLPATIQTIFEPTSDGYYFLVVIPWSIMPTGKLENVGDQISFALKANDYDNDNFEYVDGDGNVNHVNHNHWGGTTENDAYWAIAYFGARATLEEGTLNSSFEPLTNSFDAFYANNQLTINSTEANLFVTIYDIDGKVRGEFKGDYQIDMSFLNSGYYVANISDRNGNRSIVKFVK